MDELTKVPIIQKPKLSTTSMKNELLALKSKFADYSEGSEASAKRDTSTIAKLGTGFDAARATLLVLQHY